MEIFGLSVRYGAREWWAIYVPWWLQSRGLCHGQRMPRTLVGTEPSSLTVVTASAGVVLRILCAQTFHLITA